ncbi:MAG: 50S ribosomal protein L23 [Planctomycetes bacterium]|nr:50S ribosomal protein L23 [Planctomycetota bacterium]
MSANVAPEYIVKRPRLSEKSTFAMNEQKRYTFDVDPRASKTEIKDAIQKIYKVRVVGVNTKVHQARARRLRFGVVAGALTKVAVVRLHPEDSIELF